MSVRNECEGMSEELTEWYRNLGDTVRREDDEDSRIWCADKTESSQRQLHGLESRDNNFTFNKSTKVQRLLE